MPLERKPVEPAQTDPGYPTSDEYAGDRRTFLTMLGVTAATVVGLYTLRESKLFEPKTQPPGPDSAVPTAHPPGAPPVALPQAAARGEPMPAQPQAPVPGEAPAPQQQPAPQPIPDPVRPQAQIRGKVAAPETVRPVAPPAGGIKPAQPRAQVPGGIKAPEPAPAPAPVQPAANAKGGVGFLQRSEPKTVAQKPPLFDEDF